MMWRRFAADEVRQIVGRLCREIIKPVVLKGWDGGGREVAGEVSSNGKQMSVLREQANFD